MSGYQTERHFIVAAEGRFDAGIYLEMTNSNLDHIRACITSFRFHGDGDFKIAMTLYESADGFLTPQKVKGNFPQLAQVGEWYSFEGNFVADTKASVRGAEVFNARKIRPDLPITARGAMELFDKTFRLSEHGISSSAISEFVRKYGNEAALKAEDKPEILLEMVSPGSREAYRNVVLEAWAKRISARKPHRFLKAAAVSDDASDAIIRYHKDLAVDKIKADPYGLIKITGVGFEDVDKIGRYLGIPEDDIRRIAAGLLDCIATAEADGHTVVALESLAEEIAKRKLTMPHLVKFARAMTKAHETGVAFNAVGQDVVIQSYKYHHMETQIATKLASMLKRAENNNDQNRFDAVVDRVLASNPKFARFDEIQREAVRICVRNPIAILTGGPGTGKSTVTEAIVLALQELGVGVIYPMAPTGKAAVRLKETTGRSDVVTIHSALQATGEDGDGGFGRNASNQYPSGSIIIIDEASMVDTRMAYSLLQALPEDARLLLVGDRWQLPSVDPGNVISDLLTAVAENGARIPAAELKNVYRSAKDSGIATGAIEVRNGTFDIGRVDNTGREGVAFYAVRRSEIVNQTINLVRLLRQPPHGLDPKRDLGILCPQYEKIGGTVELNRALQQELNAKGREIGFLAPLFKNSPKKGPAPRVGDRVMLTRNIHPKKVANGDVGIIIEATEGDRNAKPPTKGSVTVELESGMTVRFTEAEARDLVVAYAITGHKSQGSQYPAVIMPMSTDFSPKMLYRSLTYTMWTRAKNKLFIVGEEQAFNMSMENTKPSRRSTRLKHHLTKLLNDQIKPSKDMLNANIDMFDHTSVPAKGRPSAAAAPRPQLPPVRPPQLLRPGMARPVAMETARTPTQVSPPALRPPPLNRPPVMNPLARRPSPLPGAVVQKSAASSPTAGPIKAPEPARPPLMRPPLARPKLAPPPLKTAAVPRPVERTDDATVPKP